MASSASSPQATPPPIVLRGVTVVDTRDGSHAPDQDIRIGAGQIVEITPTGSVPADDSAEIIDASGKFVVPGYLDLHAHPLEEKDPAPSLTLMLALGITGFRQMSGSPALLSRRRQGTLRLPADSPELLSMPGALLTPVNAGTAEAAVAAVREQKAAGADFIKAGLVAPVPFFAAQAEARRLDIPIVGHLPVGIDVRAASEGGMKSIEHLGPGLGILAACSSDEAALQQALRAQPTITLPRFAIPFLAPLVGFVVRKIVVNPLNRSKPADLQLLQRAVDTFDAGKAQELAARFVADGTWQSVTLIRERTTELCDAPEFRDDPHLRYVTPSVRKQWLGVAAAFVKRFSDAERATFRAAYGLQLRLTKLFDEAGVKLLAGSDVSGAVWEIPGLSLHQEFDELARAGLSPLRVLQTTTLNGAEFLGRTATMGTVEPGRNADLVLLDGDPIESVANLHRVAGVVRAGRHYSAADLAALRRELEVS